MKKAIVVVAALLLAACAVPAGRKPEAASAAAPAPAAAERGACASAPTALETKDLEPGKGEPITIRTAVLVSYTGWLFDGCAPETKGPMFDTSARRGAPLGLVVGAGRVIKGWDEGLVGMREGGKRRLVIPPDKGYGAAGSPSGAVPPNATLVFDVEIVQVIQRPSAQ